MFKRGDRVQHINHGYGQVIEVKSDTEVECFFKHGMVDGGRGKLWATVPTSFLTPEPKPATALTRMVDQLDTKRPSERGYIAYRKEIVDILNELSERVPANVFLEPTMHEGEVTVSIHLSFTLERGLL